MATEEVLAVEEEPHNSLAAAVALVAAAALRSCRMGA